jgi:hypothetical protein
MTGAAHDVTLATKRHPQWEVKVMEKRNRRYDADLEMFVEPSCEPDMAHLRFMRWLAERGHLEHRTAGASSGDFTVRSAVADDQVDLRRAA